MRTEQVRRQLAGHGVVKCEVAGEGASQCLLVLDDAQRLRCARGFSGKKRIGEGEWKRDEAGWKRQSDTN